MSTSVLVPRVVTTLFYETGSVHFPKLAGIWLGWLPVDQRSACLCLPALTFLVHMHHTRLLLFLINSEDEIQVPCLRGRHLTEYSVRIILREVMLWINLNLIIFFMNWMQEMAQWAKNLSHKCGRQSLDNKGTC